MSSFLLYLLKSTFCIGLLHLAFRTFMCKEGFFALNRIVLITIVVFSFIIPLLYLPSTVKPIIHEQIIPQVLIHNSEEQPVTTIGEMDETSASISSPVSVQKENPLPYSSGHIIFLFYLAGILFSFLVFMHGILSVLFLLRKAKAVRKDGYYVFILEKDIPAFSFCKMIFISKADYTEHGKTILTHEMQHIRLGHFYDLLLLEIAKMLHWFNPIIYWLIKDLKAIHEFQADRHTLNKGIDVNKYQLLIIEKGVGAQKFALANSFNHCQIKKRISMMNKQMTSKAGIWKVATFLPLLALLLMAFGRTGENVQKDNSSGKEMLNQVKATVNESTSQSKDSIYSIVEVMPEFPGGQKAQIKWLRENIKYPEAAKGKIQGKVFVNFIITNEGKITNPKIVRSVDPILDTEALRVVSIMPQWIPAKVKGKNVSVSYTLPINFVLSPGPEEKTKGETAPPPPPPNKDKHTIKLNKDGSINYNLDTTKVSISELTDKIKSELHKNPKLQYNILIEEGKIDERLNKTKEILKANGNPKVYYFSFHVENKGKDSSGRYSSVMYSKPMDIK